jgi:membrane fusion protein (multidrug efflux system)
MKRKSTIIIAATIVTLATGTFAATKLRPAGDEVGAEEAPAEIHLGEVKPVNVETRTVEAETITEYVTARGVTEAASDVTFSAEIPGRVGFVGPELGETVKKGQVLAKINLSSLWAQQKQAKASYDLAEKTHGRLDTLGADLVSEQKLDEAKFSKRGARAQLAAINADLSKGVIRSSMSGVVTTKNVERSEFVNPGTPLYRIVDHSTIIVEAQLAETQVAQVRSGSQVEVRVDALDQSFTGTVAAVLPAADPVSKTFTVRVEVANPDLAILVGMSAELRIGARVHQELVLVPQDVIVEGQGTRSVFVANNGSAAERQVSLGPVAGDRVAVLEGLEAGDELVVTGQRYLTDGQSIRITN